MTTPFKAAIAFGLFVGLILVGVADAVSWWIVGGPVVACAVYIVSCLIEMEIEIEMDLSIKRGDDDDTDEGGGSEVTPW